MATKRKRRATRKIRRGHRPAPLSPEEIARRRADAVVAARYARRPWAGVVAAAARLTAVRPPGTVEFGQAVGELRRLVELAEADHAAEIVRAREEACASLFADDLGPHRTVVEGMGGGVERTAAISLCGRYRYRLGRTWGTGGKRCVFVMLNPSTADAEVDDPTIRRCAGFARAWGCDSLDVVNLFALRATDPAVLRATPDRVGPSNDDHLRLAFRHAELVVAAWGVHGELDNRDRAVVEIAARAGVRLRCLGLTKDGHPRHPLYVPAGTPLIDLPAGEGAIS